MAQANELTWELATFNSQTPDKEEVEQAREVWVADVQGTTDTVPLEDDADSVEPELLDSPSDDKTETVAKPVPAVYVNRSRQVPPTVLISTPGRYT